MKVLTNGFEYNLFSKNIFSRSLRHRYLVGLIGVVIDESKDVYMLTEYMANGNLVDFLRSRGRHQVEKSQLIRFAL
jgi:serine/threonine protein kinase